MNTQKTIIDCWHNNNFKFSSKFPQYSFTDKPEFLINGQILCITKF